VLRSTTSGTEVAYQGGITQTSYNDTGVTNGTTYYYKVQAANSAGTSGNSNEAFATPTCSAPATPAGLSATPGNAQVALSWSAVSGAASYNVKRSTDNVSYTTLTGVTGTGYTDTSVSNGTQYWYVVSAVNSCGESQNSSAVSATPSAPTLPAAPTGLTATAGRKRVTLVWNAVSGATSYNVLRNTTGSTTVYTTVATGVTSSSFNDLGLTPSATYYYVVQAVNAAGTSPNSNQASATPR
jgi:cellulose 1,4-beta-cellobiosidase